MGVVPFLPIILMMTMLCLRIPVAFTLVISTIVYFSFINTTMPIEVMVQTMVASTESFPYLAIPFFTCAGVVFNYAGITEKLMTLANLMIGHVRGGMAQVNVLLAAMMGGLSGSANADAAMQTKMIVPEMTKLGYDKGFSTACTAAASCITPIIPPGIILILYALVADVSVARMFFAGYLPGLMLCGALMLAVAFVANRRKYSPSRTSRASWNEVGRQAVDSLWALLLPVFLLLGLRFGVFTPTEAGAVCVLYAVLVGVFVYRRLTWSHVPKILLESVEATAGIMFIICSAMAFGSYLTWEAIPVAVSQALVENVSSPWMLLLVINVLLLVIGCFFEGGAAMVLMAPLFIPAVKAMNIDLIHFGMLMSVNLTIAGFTPPVGMMMFVTLAISKVSMEDYVKDCWPFLIALFGVLMLITFVPSIVLVVPNLLM